MFGLGSRQEVRRKNRNSLGGLRGGRGGLSRLEKRLRFEPLEERQLLSLTVSAPVLVSFDDANAAADTTFTASSSNTHLTATVVHTTTLLKMQVHTVNADGSANPSGEMDFLLLGDVAPNNIAHVEALANAGFYNGLTFHRIIQDFMIQGGDPLGTGSGGSGTDGAKGQTQDDEFNVDIRFTSSGLLAMANSGTDTNDCQFFITAGKDTSGNFNYFRDGDYQYTIIGKLVAGDTVRQEVAGVSVVDNGSGETSKPVNPPIIDSVSIVTNTEYGLVLLKPTSAATANETATVQVTASDGSTVTVTADGETPGPSLSVTTATDTPSTKDRPAFLGAIANVTTTMNTPVTISVPAVEGDAGVPLSYQAATFDMSGTVNPANLKIAISGTGPSDGSATLTPSNNIVGLYYFGVGVGRNSSDTSTNTNIDIQYVPIFIRPAAPTGLSVTTAGVTNGGVTMVDHDLKFHVTGVQSGVTVAIFADGNSTPIGTATATGDTVDVQTSGQLAEGSHTFTVEALVHYAAATVRNQAIAAGELYSDPSASIVQITVVVPPTPNPSLWATVPYSTGPTSIRMVAQTATDPDGVQYFFHSLTAGGHDSGWQASPIYEDTGLLPGTTYSYQVKTRDQSANQTTGNYSAAASATTTPSTFVLTGPTFGTYQVGSSIGIQWTAGNVASGEKISLCYDTDTSFNGNEHWIEIDQVKAANGSASYAWNTTGVAPGTYYVAGYMFDGSQKFITSRLYQTITITSTVPTPTLVISGPTSGTYLAGQLLNIPWTADAVPAGGKISLCYDTDATFNGNEHWIEVDQVAASYGSHPYMWDTTGVAPGTYYMAGYMSDGKGTYATSHLTSAITITDKLTPPQTFAVTSPAGSSYQAGQTVNIPWTAGSVAAAGKISLCYDTDTTFNGNERWIEVDQVAAANGSNTYAWNTTGVAAGTYYLAGYMYDGGQTFTTSHLTQAITITTPVQTFAVTGPTSGSYQAGQAVSIGWTAGNVAAAGKISLCYDTDTTFNGNEHWIEVDRVAAANGANVYTWDTKGVAPGTYYLAGYMYDGGATFTTSHLAQSITITAAPVQTFAVTGPTSGLYQPGQTVNIAWTAGNVLTGSKISLCYDTDTTFNGNEHWIEIDAVAASDGSHPYLWDTSGVAPGTYYLAGYMFDGGTTFTTSHLAQAITIGSA
jgi:cyclophilin family peptidyl-prolyl cis-trans isomerase